MKKLLVISIGLMACLAIGISTAQGQVVYGVTDLGVVKDMQTSEVFAINQYGHVAGTGHSGSETCAFHYYNQTMEDSGGVNSRGFGISSTNIVVGDSFFGPALATQSHAAMFNGAFAVAKDLGVLKGHRYSRANGANAIGQVVGFSGLKRDSSQSRAFLWTYQTGMRDIGTLGGSYAQANAINEAGFITGTAQTLAVAAVKATHAFIYNPMGAGPAAMRDLGVLGGNSSYGMAINNHNHVAGYSTFNANSVNANSELVHAFLHDGNKMFDLGSLGKPGTVTDVSAALGVNKLDQVVGYSYRPAGAGIAPQQVAFLWTRGTTASGKMINLNKLLRATDRHYLLISATAINDNGQIVANAYDTLKGGGPRAVLLTPMGP